MSGHSPRASRGSASKRSSIPTVDSGDTERVAHGAVGRRAPPLHQDVVGAAVLDDVIHDEEVAGEVEAPDDLQLVGDLAARLAGERSLTVARACPLLGQRAQVLVRGLAGGQRIVGEAIADVLEREGQAHGQLAGIRDGLGEIGEEARHLQAGLEAALVVQRQETAGGVERGLLADAGQHVGQRASAGPRGEVIVTGALAAME